MVFDNPEFVRLCRSKMRPGKIVLLAGIAAFICGGILVLMYLAETQFGRQPVNNMGEMLRNYFFWCTGIELAAVTLFGCILSAQNVVLERERSTLDFQRLVAIGPLRLTLGKLFGAPLEAFFVAAVCALFSVLGAMGGAVSPGYFAEVHIAIFLFGFTMSALGLLCSCVVEKTNNAAGLAVLLGGALVVLPLMFVGRGGNNIVAASSPIWFMISVFQHDPLGGYNGYNQATRVTIDFLGLNMPAVFAGIIVNAPLALVAFLACVRRISNDEFSFMNIWQAALAFAITQFVLIGTFISGGAGGSPRYSELESFHAVNFAMLLGFTFALTPNGELVRARLYRARPGQQWGVLFELKNRMQDCPAMAGVLLFTVLYAIVGLVLTQLNGGKPQDFAAIVMVAGASMGMAAMLMYVHVYLERGSFRLALIMLIALLALPPLAMGITYTWDHAVLVNPLAYIFNMEKLDRLYMQRNGPAAVGAVWSCPAACLTLGVLGFVLVAMRVRYVLDVHERERTRDAEAQRKADQAVPALTAEARLLAKQ